MNKLEPDRTQAKAFLAALDPAGARFTFQTFDDRCKNPTLARILHGTLAQHWNTLAQLNAQGAGVYVTVNETNLRGRKASDIVRVRCLFLDLDGAPLPCSGPAPHFVV